MLKTWTIWSQILISLVVVMISAPTFAARDTEFGTQIYLTEWSRLKHRAELGDPDALFILGNYYYSPPKGSNFKKNLKKSAKYYFEAAIRGNAAAQYNFAFMLHKGLGVNSDSIESYVWFKLAASNDSNVAKHVVKLSQKAVVSIGALLDKKDFNLAEEKINYYRNIIEKKTYRKAKFPG